MNLLGACPLDLNLDLILHSVYKVPKQIECKGFQNMKFLYTISHLDIHYKQPQKTINVCGCLWLFAVVCGEFPRVISDVHYKVCGFD